MHTTTNEGASAAERDLRWFFARTDTGPLKSNYGAMVYRLAMGGSPRGGHAGAEDDQVLESAARAGGVARVLRSLDRASADLLWRAYGAEWPEELELLGDLWALAPTTEAAKRAHRDSGDPRALTEWFEDFLGSYDTQEEQDVLSQIQKEAESTRDRALAAYLNCRRRIGPHA